MLGKLSDSQIEILLQSEWVARLACVADNQPYVVPIPFALEGEYIYGHSKEGKKIAMMRKNPNVCLEVDSIENLANWRSVIVHGQFEEIRLQKEQHHAMKILSDKFAPVVASEMLKQPKTETHPPFIVEKASQAIYFRIKIEEKSGRFEKHSF